MQDYSFPVSHKLCCSEEFDAVFQGRDHVVSHPSFLFLAKGNERGFNRLGMVIGKKSVQRAVDRNRIKRKLRESFRRLPAKADGVDIVILARPGVRKEEQLFVKVNRLFHELLEKVSET